VNALVLAATFAVISFPLYKKVLWLFRGKLPSVASAVTVVMVSLIVLTPLTYLGVQVFTEANLLYERLSDPERSEENPLGADVRVSTNKYLQGIQEKIAGGLAVNFESYVQRGLTFLFENVGEFFKSIAAFGLALFIWVLAFYYFLRDGKRLSELFVHFSPLSDKYDKEIVDRIGIAIRSTIGGSLIVALLQGILAGVGFAIFGIPTPAIWGLVAVLAALIPTVGTAIVTLPAVGYLLVIGHTSEALGMLIWGVVIVGLVDNILRPKLIERGIRIHPLIILLSVLGGIALFGPVGFITGPIIVTLLGELLKIYREMIVEGRNKQLSGG